MEGKNQPVICFQALNNRSIGQKRELFGDISGQAFNDRKTNEGCASFILARRRLLVVVGTTGLEPAASAVTANHFRVTY